MGAPFYNSMKCGVITLCYGHQCSKLHQALDVDGKLNFSGASQAWYSVMMYIIWILFYLCVYICSWNEWLTLPIKYSDLPRNAQLALTIWDIYGSRDAVPVGGTTVSVFGKKG